MQYEMYSFNLVPGSAPPQTCETLQAMVSSSITLPEERKTSDPIKFKLERSISETQLFDDEQEAEYRDYCMYLRIAGGMLRHCTNDVDDLSLLDSIVRTRHAYNTMTSDLYLLDDHSDASDTASSTTPPLSSYMLSVALADQQRCNRLFTTSSRRKPADETRQLDSMPLSSKSIDSPTLYFETYESVYEDCSVGDEIFVLDF
jgi:hypothetical protein